eukprot:symbB.v1.2.017880.t1/scaffold1334.1/size124731/14
MRQARTSGIRPKRVSPAPRSSVAESTCGSLSDYIKVRTVGRGSFGEALLVKHRSSGQLSVLKRVRLEVIGSGSDAEAAAESAAREAQVLHQLRHPHIVEFLAAFVDSSRDTSGGTLCLLMAFCEGGDLQHRLQKVRQECRRLQEQPVLRWFDELCSALAYVHQRQVLHRDLKPSNIFLTGRGSGFAHSINEEESVAIGDFGVSRPLTHAMELVTTMVGTPCYLSPEVPQCIVFQDVPFCGVLLCPRRKTCTIWSPPVVFHRAMAKANVWHARDIRRHGIRALCVWLGWLGLGSQLFSVAPTADKRFLLARHGQTTFNAEKRFQGTMNEEPVLTEKGREQARDLGKWLKEQRVDVVFVSPLLRAQETLALAKEVAGSLPDSSTTFQELREIELYEWEGLTQEEVKAKTPEQFRQWKEEAHPAVQGLVIGTETIGNCCEAAPSNAASLIVAHGTLGKALLATALGLPEEAFRHFAIKNGEVVEVVFPEEKSGKIGAKWRKLHPTKGDSDPF